MNSADFLQLIEKNSEYILTLVSELKGLSKDSENATRRLDGVERDLLAQQKLLAGLEGKARDVATWARALKWTGGSIVAALLFLSSMNGFVVIWKFFNP